MENLTSNSDILGSSTEVTASVSVLVTATKGVSDNITVRIFFSQRDSTCLISPLKLTTTFLEVVDNILDVNQDILLTSQETSNTSAKLVCFFK